MKELRMLDTVASLYPINCCVGGRGLIEKLKIYSPIHKHVDIATDVLKTASKPNPKYIMQAILVMTILTVNL